MYNASLGTEDMPFGTMTVSLTLRSDRFSLTPWWHHPAPTGVLCFVRKKSSSERLVFMHREPGIQSSGISSHSVLSSWVIWVCPWFTLSGADAIRETGCFPRSLKEIGMLSLYHINPMLQWANCLFSPVPQKMASIRTWTYLQHKEQALKTPVRFNG